MNKLSIFYEHIAEAAKQSGLSVEEVCGKVKGFGYDYVEIDAKRLMNEGETILPMLEKAGLGIGGMYYFFDFGADENFEANDRAAAERIVALCAPANCRTILCVPGFLKENELERGSEAYELRRTRMLASLRVLIALAEKEGITVVMEDFDGYAAPFSTAAELLWFMKNADGVRCGFDTGNFLYSEEDAAAVLPDFLPYISGVHLKDRGWTENDGNPKATVLGRKMYPVAVGDGDLDIAGMLRTILETGYTGVLAAEHFDSANQLRDMERSANYLKGLLADA